MAVKNVTIIIPVYNEELYIEEILRNLLEIKFPGIFFEIIVVDDGSTDKTRQILEKSFFQRELRVYYQEKNFGKGAAIRVALKYTTGDIVFIQDADLEYSVFDYPKLLEPILCGKASVVYGSRFLGKITGMRLINKIFNIFIRGLVNLLFNASISDVATAYKVVKTDVIRSLNLKSQRFEICPEITAKLLKRKIKIYEVPICYRARNKEYGKKISWIDGIFAIIAVFKYRFTD